MPSRVKEVVLEALEQLPDGSAVCHGDFHPRNIIISSRGPVIIDWANATQGNPLADVAWILLASQTAAWQPGTGK
ncbi:phosphotransferase family protein [Chloroflexota bacterium]